MMETLISTIVFILPGFMLYFWIQMLGVTPVVKHSTVEFGAMAALAWFPVVILSLQIMRLYRDPITTVDQITSSANDISFLIEFAGISVVTSFLLSVIYLFAIYPLQMTVINFFRVTAGKVALSKSPSVWEEVFFGHKYQIIGIAKFGAEKPDLYGNIVKVSRPIEPKRGFKLVYTQYVKEIIEKYEVPVEEIFTDIDSGVNVFIYDYMKYKEADAEERKDPKYIQTPSRSSTF